MKARKTKNTFLLAFMFATTIAFSEGFIPEGNNDFYYRIGGGQSIPMPAYTDTQSIPLSVNAQVGLGVNCGVFNPKASITNSLNNIKDSFQNVTQQVLANATSAVAEFPLYILSRANPNLYNLINNGLLSARKDLALSTKSCEVMQQEIADGKNPYTDWATLSMGDDWKYHMNDASSSTAFSDTKNDDINQVKAMVAKDNGNQGVPWVQGINTRGALHAGGIGQPPIQVIHDTAIAGYNVILGSRAYNDTSAPVRNKENAKLLDNFASPLIAADWIVQAIGDEAITTYSQGEKKSTPGIGLLPQTEKLTRELSQKLAALVSGTTPLTLENLKAVSAPRVFLNEAVIQTLKQKSPVLQSILIQKIAQEASASSTIDKAELALQILEEGSFVPAIYSNEAATKEIAEASKRLRLSIQDLLFNAKVNQQLGAHTLSMLLQSTKNEEMATTTIQAGEKATPEIDNGAVILNKNKRMNP